MNTVINIFQVRSHSAKDVIFRLLSELFLRETTGISFSSCCPKTKEYPVLAVAPLTKAENNELKLTNSPRWIWAMNLWGTPGKSLEEEMKLEVNGIEGPVTTPPRGCGETEGCCCWRSCCCRGTGAAATRPSGIAEAGTGNATGGATAGVEEATKGEGTEL